jgi:hypothetical protein
LLQAKRVIPYSASLRVRSLSIVVYTSRSHTTHTTPTHSPQTTPHLHVRNPKAKMIIAAISFFIIELAGRVPVVVWKVPSSGGEIVGWNGIAKCPRVQCPADPRTGEGRLVSPDSNLRVLKMHLLLACQALDVPILPSRQPSSDAVPVSVRLHPPPAMAAFTWRIWD